MFESHQGLCRIEDRAIPFLHYVYGSAGTLSMPECAKVEYVAERPRGSIRRYLFYLRGNNFSITGEELNVNVAYFNVNGKQHFATDIDDFREYIDEDLFSGIKSLFDANNESRVKALEDTIDELKGELGDKECGIESLEDELNAYIEDIVQENSYKKLEFITNKLNRLLNSVAQGYIKPENITESIERILCDASNVTESSEIEMDGCFL